MALRAKLPQVDFSDPGFKLLAVALAGFLFLFLGYVSAPTREAPAPPALETGPTYVRGTIESVQGSRLTLSTEAGPVTIELAPDTTFERLRRGSFVDLAPGQTVNVGSIPHAQTLFVVIGVVVIPGALAESAP